MNPTIAHLFGRLEAKEELAQSEAVTHLAMLLERNNNPEREDATWRLVLTEDLLALRLSSLQINEALDAAVSLLCSDQVYRSSKLSLVGVIARNADIDHAEVLLKCFSEFAETFNEQEAFSFVGSFAQFLVGLKSLNQIESLFVKYNTLGLLERLQKNGSPRLQESAVRVISYIGKR